MCYNYVIVSFKEEVVKTIEINKVKDIKTKFDKITSNNSKNWELVIFWIISFSIFASIIEYIFVNKKSAIIIHIPTNILNEFFIAILIVGFVWGCIYNLVSFNIKNIFYHTLFGLIGLDFIITQDFNFSFLFYGLLPIDFFNTNFSIVLCIILLFKLLILYLTYQLFICLIYRKKSNYSF